MNKPIQNGGPSSWGLRYPLVVQNAGSEPAPGYAVVQVVNSSSASESAMYLVQKPNGDPNAQYVLLSPQGLGDTPGGATNEYPALALITGSPAINQEIGPVNGSWMLTTSGKGFVYRGGLAGGIGRVTAKASVQAGDDFPLVRIVNNTGLPLPFGSIVGYGVPTDPPPITLYRIPSFFAAAPIADSPFCVTLSAIPSGETGDAAPVGVVACQVYINDATHLYVKAASGNTSYLPSDTAGAAKIIWRERGSVAGAGTLGLQWARVLLGSGGIFGAIRGVVSSSAAGATGSVGGPITPGIGQATIYVPPSDTSPVGTPWNPGQSVTFENWMRTVVAMKKPILLRESRRLSSGQIIYEPISEGCTAVPDSGSG